MRAHAQTMWKSLKVVMSSLVFASCSVCEWEGDVIAVVASLGGVAQVVSHGVKVVGVHGEEGEE